MSSMVAEPNSWKVTTAELPKRSTSTPGRFSEVPRAVAVDPGRSFTGVSPTE